MIYNASDSDRVPDLAGQLELADNPDQRTPCILLLDTSYSMSGAPIAELNEGLKVFREELMADSLAQRRVEVAVATFGGTVDPIQAFVPAQELQVPTLNAGGNTPMGAAIEQGLEGVLARTRQYREAGVPHTRPWVFLITDGAPTDDWQQAAAQVRRHTEAKRLVFFAVAVQGADMGTLSRIAAPDRPPLQLAGLHFRELFQWLSVSLSQVSRSAAGQQVALPARDGWEAV